MHTFTSVHTDFLLILLFMAYIITEKKTKLPTPHWKTHLKLFIAKSDEKPQTTWQLHPYITDTLNASSEVPFTCVTGYALCRWVCFIPLFFMHFQNVNTSFKIHFSSKPTQNRTFSKNTSLGGYNSWNPPPPSTWTTPQE